MILIACYAVLLLFTIGIVTWVLWPLMSSKACSRTWFVGGAAVLGLCACALYAKLGAGGALPAYWAAQREQAAMEQLFSTIKTPEALIARLKTQVEANATDPKGWYLLGKLYFATNQPKLGCAAIRKAAVLAPHDPAIQAQRKRC